MAGLLDDLNQPQQDAVLHAGGPLLVLAGAGSGKTRVITRRIAHLVTERKVEPWRILAVTFTNKAAREMRERLEQLLGEKAQGLVVSTFHSAAAMFLRKEAEAAGISRNFVIYDDSDQLQTVKRAMREASLDPTSMNPREVLSRIDQEKNQGRLPDDMKVDGDVKGEMVRKVYRTYMRQLRAANALDFGDLLLLLVRLLRDNAEVRVKFQRRFQHVLVDEFQDTNPVQYQLLRLLAPPGSNVVVVGDDDQSIYRWRGAEVENILNFPSHYEGCVVVKLEQNYRSDQTILEAAHAVIANNRRRMDKKLWSSRAKGEPLGLLIFRDERQEAQDVASRIHALRRDGIADYGQVAVFFRTHAQSRILEEAMRLGRVPYTLVSGRSFYERQEIRDAASYLRLMVNPRSDADLLRVINVPARGIGDTTVERITDYAQGAGLSLFEAIEVPERIPALNGGAVKRLRAFRDLLDRLVAQGQGTPTASAAAEAMFRETGLITAWMAEGTDEAMTRAENLQELLSATRQFDQELAGRAPEAAARSPEAESFAVATTPLEGFLERVSLVGEADGDTPEGKVSLMTLHAAKGLEYDAVFMTGMEEEIFPHRRATQPESSEEDMAEERRLCYVGFTRARRRLYVSLAQQRVLFGELRFNPPSRFLTEVPKELFGFTEDFVPPARPLPPQVRRRSYSDDDGPRIDRSYDQSTDFHQDGDGEVKGMRVSHSQFGKGVVLDVQGRGPNAKLTVRFEAVGTKTVIARFLSPA
ncbi:MAG: UvrD-helicase domain-containing protein [Myxococcaceae bacterium]|nr:UvrD-helicase domain-containing protein [Myxococcaceae bacterium]